MQHGTILIVDDEQDVLNSMRHLLSNTFHILTASSTEMAIEVLKTNNPNAVIADLQMSGLDGISLCKFVRTHPTHKNIPVLIVSAMTDQATRTDCFVWGADDFIAKPFSGSELIARVYSKLRWSRKPVEEADDYLKCGNLEVNEKNLSITIDGEKIPLTIFEFRMLKHFIQKKDTVLNRDTLLQEVWEDSAVTHRTVDVHIYALRNKLSKFNYEFHTVHGVGYILREK